MTKVTKVKKIIKPLLILLFALSLMLTFYVGLGFHDDIVYADLAHLASEGDLPLPRVPTHFIFTLRPGVYYPMAFFYKLFGIKEYAASLPFILFSLGIVMVTFFLGKILFNERVGVLAALFLSVLPLFLFYSTQYGPDIPLTFFGTLSMLLFFKGKKALTHNKKFYFLSGIFLGFTYLTKITFVIFGFIYTVFFIRDIISNRKFFFSYLLLFLGFTFIFISENIYYFSQTSQLFLSLASNFVAYYNPLNPNPDSLFYLKALFGLIAIDDFYFFGIFSYLALIAIIYLLWKRPSGSFYLLVWFLLPYLSFEFIFPALTSAKAIEKDVRFLIPMLVPMVIILGKFLEDLRNFSRFIFSIALVIIFLTSLYFSFDATSYVRTAMGDVREAYNFLQDLPPKKIYTNLGYGNKLKFFFKFRKSPPIYAYNCARINCNLDYYDSGKYIEDSYIILNPDWHAVYIKKEYPHFIYNPPNDWILLKVIDLKPPIKHSYLYINEYNPEIYYAPPKTEISI